MTVRVASGAIAVAGSLAFRSEDQSSDYGMIGDGDINRLQTSMNDRTDVQEANNVMVGRHIIFRPKDSTLHAIRSVC